LFIVAGLFTRINAVLLAGALSGVILYTIGVVTSVFIGGGKYSLEAMFASKGNWLLAALTLPDQEHSHRKMAFDCDWIKGNGMTSHRRCTWPRGC
jgi:hypothetical protein